MKVLKKKPGENWELRNIDPTWEALEKEIGKRFEATRCAINVTIVCKKMPVEPNIRKISDGTFGHTVLAMDPHWDDITDEAVKLFAPELLADYAAGTSGY